MEPAEQLSLSWDSHQKSICSGLSLLQQRGEFVDMTLAADGHHVKVHQMVMSLVSPYIKELISSAQCPHPVIFLNNISYSTLCAILEYIYTGEVLMDKSKLSDLIAAGKALHIRGLQEMDDEEPTVPIEEFVSDKPIKKNITKRLKELKKKNRPTEKQNNTPVPLCKVYLDVDEDSTMDIRDESMDLSENASYSDSENHSFNIGTLKEIRRNQKPQYTLSNQGGLQIIYNRYIYQLRYCGKRDGTKSWRCVDYNSLRCSANLFTDKNNEVKQRSSTHNHPFHDSKILKMVQLGKIYSVFQEAKDKSGGKKKERLKVQKDADSNDTSDD